MFLLQKSVSTFLLDATLKNNAKSEDMLRLIEFTKKEVENKFNIQLELEIVIVD